MKSLFPFQTLSIAILLSLCSALASFGQESRIAKQIAEKEFLFNSSIPIQPLVPVTVRNSSMDIASNAVSDAKYFSIDPEWMQYVHDYPNEFLQIEIQMERNSIRLKMLRADIFSETFRLYAAADPDQPFPYKQAVHYWGVVEGEAQSLVALSFNQDEIMGFIQIGEDNYTLGKLQDDPVNTHILYKTDGLKETPGVNCFVDDSHIIGSKDKEHSGSRSNADNCVRMCIHVDYDIVTQKGGVQQAADYVNGAFSQVAILYANESIDLVVNEMIVWNVSDPFIGPTTSNYLNQFRNYLNGNYNGDLAHLVGYGGGGGIAYLDVLCEYYYGVGYSGINSTYANVPAYSWTVEVLTHEIGHNLGSPHTHACAWNGNNTAIDGCGPAAGYSEGCNAPLPASGTIMSYCHLIGGVGINFNNGFGPQPGDLIRNRVYNSACLTPCGPPIQYDAGITAINEPIALPCSSATAPVVVLQNFGAVPLTSVTINYQLDNNATQTYAWNGSLAQNQTTTVTLPFISYGTGPHTLDVFTSDPNGQADEVPSNDETSTVFTYFVDWCVCNSATASLTPNPLTHTGSGSSSASASFAVGSKKPNFTITGLNAKLNGPGHNRFIEQVVVTYVDGNGQNQTYGTFYGNQQSSVNVDIQTFVNSVSVELSNSYGNNYNGTLSVSFGTVNYCAPGAGCSDADGDGVCDEDDVCPDFDDNLIGTSCDDGDACTNNDVYTVNCLCEGTVIPNCDCPTSTSNFSPNPLTHIGSGQSNASSTLPAGNTDPNFVISNLDAKLNGNPNGRYIEEVTVTYVNGSGNTLTYGVFRGDQVSSVNVNIAGAVQSITLTLADAYDGNSSTELSVSMTSVTSCGQGGALTGPDDGGTNNILIYPNPASGEFFVRWDKVSEETEIHVYNTIGVLLGTFNYSEVKLARITTESLGITGGEQMLFVNVKVDGEDVGVRSVMVGM